MKLKSTIALVFLGVSLISVFLYERERREQVIFSIPIFTYHAVLDSEEDIWADIQVTKSQFGMHLRQLREAGYETITFADVKAYQKFRGTLPKKPIILTFDDTHESLYTNAFSLLKELNMKGVFFINSGWVEGNGKLTWDWIREMRSTGIEIGGHTTNHTELSDGLSQEVLEQEIVEDKEKIESELEETVYSFSYPANTTTPEAMEVLKTAGYRIARAGENVEETLNTLYLSSTIVTNRWSLNTF